MEVASWLGFAALALLAWGTAGLLLKLSTNHISSECGLVWLIAGFLVLQPWLYPGSSLFAHSVRSLAYALLAGVFNAIAFWALLSALRSGGKAAIVVPFTALYPVVVVFAAPIVLNESITPTQGVGILCGLGAVVLLSK
ncbi:MAG: DMT family transporter [Acidobacteria bacterium]|nr:DMT family transporter [Acidobacteriota bacterium]